MFGEDVYDGAGVGCGYFIEGKLVGKENTKIFGATVGLCEGKFDG
jgi:hypothetical protein